MHEFRLSRAALLLLPVLTLMACASAPRLWQPRTVRGCVGTLGAPQLDQERTFLATLLALSTRQYAIVHSEEPVLIEAESRSDYHPEVFHTRWLLRVHTNGVLEVDAPETRRETHKKTELWYQKLTHTVAQYACRDLNWLRWEAQNRGLLAVGAGLPAASLPEASAGGEAPVALQSAHDPSEPLPTSPQELALRQPQLDQLRRQRTDLHLWRAVGWSGAGVVLMASAAGIGSQALTQYYLSPQVSRALGYTAVGIAAAGGVVLAVSLPLMFRRVPRYKALSREMKALRAPPLALTPGAARASLGLTLRGSF